MTPYSAARLRVQDEKVKKACGKDTFSTKPADKVSLHETKSSFLPVSTSTSTKAGSAVRPLQDELVKAFGKDKLKPKRAVEAPLNEKQPFICKNPKELSKARKVQLRTATQTLCSSDVQLNQFDPCFFSSVNIWCRYSGCKQQKKRQPGNKKEHLYLCPVHRKTTEDVVAKMCKEKEINVMMNHSKDFDGYTSLIGMLENAFISLPKPKAHVWCTFKNKSCLVQQICLNLRNYFIIVNTLLNPCDENVVTVLTAPMATLQEIFRILRDDGEIILQRLRELVDLLRSIIEHILFTFGVIYSWIYLSLSGNPGAQVGAGIGGFIGMAGHITGPVVGTLTAVSGAVFGGLIGSGLYTMLHRYFKKVNNEAQRDPNRQLQDPPIEETPVYYLRGSATGNLIILVIKVNLAGSLYTGLPVN